MSDLLIKLGDDWHNSHPYERLIHSILPDLSFEAMQEIEHFLLKVYEAQHYDFKSFKDKSKHTVYDLDISRAERDMELLKSEMKKDEATLERLCKKLEETVQEQRKHGFVQGEVSESDEEDDEEEENMYQVEKDMKVTKVTKDSKKQGKDIQRERKLLEVQLVKTLKSTQSSMATVQEKLMESQKRIELLEKKKEYYEHYRNASFYYQDASRKLVLDYEQKKDVEALVKGINDILSYYTVMRRRYVPTDLCKGSGKELCEVHLLPLHTTKYTEKGEPIAWKCGLYA